MFFAFFWVEIQQTLSNRRKSIAIVNKFINNQMKEAAAKLIAISTIDYLLLNFIGVGG